MERWRDADAEEGEPWRKFDLGREKVPTSIAAPILQKMGDDIQANIGNIPFDELQAMAEEAAGGMDRWAAELDKAEKEMKGKPKVKGKSGGGLPSDKERLEIQKKINQSEAAIVKYNNEYANIRAVMAGWNYVAHADQIEWEGRMRAAQEEYTDATDLAAKTMFEFAQAQQKRVTAAKQQLQAASDEQMIVNALAKGPSAITAKTMAQFNTQDANLEVFRQSRDAATRDQAMAATRAHKEARDIPEVGEWMTDEIKTQEKRQQHITETVAPFIAATEAAGKKFDSEVKKAAVNLLSAETKIAQARIDNQTQIDNLLDQTIQGLTGQVKGMFAGGPTEQFDAGFMESQGKMLAEMAKSAASGQPDKDELMRFGRAVQEYEDMGTGLTPQDMASLFGTTIDEFERAMRNVREASLGGLAEQTTMEGKTTLDLMDKRGSIDDGTRIKKLQDEQEGLIGAMSVVTQKWAEFAADPNTADMAKKVKDMEQAINEGSKDADDIKAHLEGVLTASESQAAFIEEQANFANKALINMGLLAQKMTIMEGKIRTLTDEGDTDPSIMNFVGPPSSFK